jgi:hypothetical protein
MPIGINLPSPKGEGMAALLLHTYSSPELISGSMDQPLIEKHSVFVKVALWMLNQVQHDGVCEAMYLDDHKLFVASRLRVK